MDNNRLANRNPNLRLRHLVLILSLALLVLIIGNSWDIVPPGHRGVAVTLGSVDDQPRPEGFTLKLPFVTSITHVCVQQVTVTGKAACYSSDLQTIDIQFAVLYHVPQGSVVKLHQQHRGDVVPSLIDPRAQEAIKTITSNYAAEKLVKSRAEIKAAWLTKLRESMGDLIEIVDLNIANIDLSDQLEDAIESKMVQEQQALAKTYELDKAKKSAEIVLVEAKAEAEAIRVKGEAVRQAPEVVQLEIVKKWNGVSPTTVMIAGDRATSTLLPLPGPESK